jgi:caspase recruitment domain-containing protein 6
MRMLIIITITNNNDCVARYGAQETTGCDGAFAVGLLRCEQCYQDCTWNRTAGKHLRTHHSKSGIDEAARSASEARRGEARRGEARRGEARRGEASQAKPSQAKPSQAKPSQAKPSQAQPSQAKPSQAKPSQAKPSHAKPSQGCRKALTFNELVN